MIAGRYVGRRESDSGVSGSRLEVGALCDYGNGRCGRGGAVRLHQGLHGECTCAGCGNLDANGVAGTDDPSGESRGGSD